MPTLLHPLLVLLFFHAASQGDPAADTYDSTVCPPSFSCGGQDIHDPFYRYDATEVIEGGYSCCSYPGMGIDCQDGRPILRLDDGNYAVLKINYDDSTLTLADPDAFHGSCPRVRHNVTVPPATPLNFTNSATNYLSFFVDCSFTSMPRQSGSAIIEPINCGGLSRRTGNSFVLPQRDVPIGDWARNCTKVLAMPVRRDLLGRTEKGQLGNGSYGTVLKQGFQLTWWDPSEGSCYKCRQSNGQCGYNESSAYLGCVCFDRRVSTTDCGSKNPKKKIIVIDDISAAAGVIFLSLLFACLLYHKKYHGFLLGKRESENAPRIESFLQKHGTLHPKSYTYSEVRKMTKYFGHKLGQGGFGTVYKGSLPNGRQIAVKMLKHSTGDGQDFANEVASISRTSHVNVVTLLGYCLQGSRRALIYDYMPNGSLERFAFDHNSEGDNSLSWEKLFDIAVGVARGLEYLHRGCNTCIVHFDIKPHNILLDQDFCPKISDFGLAKLCMQKESALSLYGVRGTIGYIAPEVFSKQFGVVSNKSDVYSYGMMVLDMVGARKNINASGGSTSSEYFPQWVYEYLDAYCVNAYEISVDTGGLVRKMIIVGLWCIQLLPDHRPSMSRVVEMLKSNTNDLQIPPKSLLN